MRGVLYRTDDDGNTLDKPELKISALKGSNIKVYANQEAKQAALENGDIKPGDVVLSGEEPDVQPITWPQLELDWSNAVQLKLSDFPYIPPTNGYLVGVLLGIDTTAAYDLNLNINNVLVAQAHRSGYINASANVQIPVFSDYTITITYAGAVPSPNLVRLSFVPYKGVNQ